MILDPNRDLDKGKALESRDKGKLAGKKVLAQEMAGESSRVILHCKMAQTANKAALSDHGKTLSLSHKR